MTFTRRFCAVLLAIACTVFLLPNTVATEGKFIDVPVKAWYYEAVEYCAEQGWMNGMGSRQFAPNEKISRAMLVLALYRFAGSPQTEKQMIFFDVPSDAPYADAVSWAVKMGIMQGVARQTFSPFDHVPREQLCCIILRYAERVDDSFFSGPMVDIYFSDLDVVSNYAYDGVQMARFHMIIQGYEDGMFRPQAYVTRGELAAVLLRMATYP